ncbi:hypothetical protein GCM10027278_31040 [Paralcaligenes ginsengisoli]
MPRWLWITFRLTIAVAMHADLFAYIHKAEKCPEFRFGTLHAKPVIAVCWTLTGRMEY